MGDQFTIGVKDVDGERTREIVDYFEQHGCIIDKFYWSPNATMDGKGTLTIIYHAPDAPQEQPKRKIWRRMRRRING